MKATAKSIWSVPAYLPYLQPTLTAAAVASAEKHLGQKLPKEYLDLLKVQNGGGIRYTLPGSVHKTIYGIGPHYPSLTGFSWDDNDYREIETFPLDGLIPFDGDGHWFICMDYRKKRVPAVTLIDFDGDAQSRVADSFADYLGLLVVEAGEREFVLPSVNDLEHVKSAIASVLGIRFDAPAAWAYGYPVHRARCGLEESPEWIWISPNRVPRGFVRKEDPRYEELRNLLPGEAERYPELPESSYVLTVTEGAEESVLAACKRKGIEVRPLKEYLG